MDPLTLTAIGMGGQALVQGLAGGIALKKGLSQKIDERTNYTADPGVTRMARESALQSKGRMANIGALERNAQGQGASSQASYNRAATDSSQAFLGTSAVEAQSTQRGMQLAQLEQQDQVRRQARADQGTLLQNQERGREIADKQLKRQEQIQTKSQLISGGLQGLTSAFGGVASIGQFQQQGNLQDAQADYYANASRSTSAPSGFTGQATGYQPGGLFQSNTLGTYNPITGQYEQ